MIDKLLTLISGNVLLVVKAVKEENKALASKIEESQAQNTKSLEKVSSGLSAITEAIQELADEMRERPAIEVQSPEVNVPEVKFPEIPTPQVTVNVPEVRIPEIKVPNVVVPAPVVNVEPQITVTPTPVSFPKEMSVTGLPALFKSVTDLLSKEKKEKPWSSSNPMPVAFIDRKGRQYDLVHLGSPRAVGGGGATPSEITGADKTLRTVAFDLSATGTVIPAVSGRRIKVYAIKLIVDAPLSVAFRDGASDLLEGMQDYVANAGYIDNIQPPAFLFATTAGNRLDLVVSGTGNVSGRISYWSDDKI